MNGLYATLERYRPYILSILRIVVGLLLLQHGLSKVFNFPAPSPVGALSGVLILAAILETFGAALFLVGAFSPIVNAGEVAILFCFIFLYFAFAGGGPLSIDRAALNQA